MQKISYLVSDLALEKEFLESLKSRIVEQKFLYMGSAADFYYDAMGVNSYYKDDLLGAEIVHPAVPFIRPHLSKNNENCIISLGCGNAQSEIPLLRTLHKEGFQFSYFGVDASRKMLELAAESLSLLKGIESQLIFADFNSDELREELSRTVLLKKNRFFCLFGATLGNVNQTSAADSLYNLMVPDDFLWLDVVTRPGISATDDLNLFNRYASYLKRPEMTAFFLESLVSIGIRADAGILQIVSDKESSVGAMAFKFFFVFHQKVIIEYRGQSLHFLPGEKIELATIRAYYPETLIQFFSDRNFSLVNHSIERISNEVSKGQFIFKKST